MCNKLFDTLFLPILLHGSEIWGAYDNMNIKKWEKDPVERLHTQFYKLFLGLDKRAPNVVARNETVSGRLSLKLNFGYILNLFQKTVLPNNALIISSQLAKKNEAKTSFMLTVNEIIHNYIDIQHQSYNKTIQTNDIPTIKNNLQN